ncbi:MAG TPA: hypothetical protein PKY88_09820 [Anaerohalosphaeraceae bacterium]|nr:hypothetical protein [Anaerohalosphaeraceae bacterium]
MEFLAPLRAQQEQAQKDRVVDQIGFAFVHHCIHLNNLSNKKQGSLKKFSDF